jgi:uncharacterized protein YdaU (DUF1376 family)
MHYYQFHVGDYMSHTIHLSPLEDLAYRRLLDMYYDSEQPIPNNIPLVSRRLRLGSDVVQSVLDEFFTLSDDGYKNHRADLEIREYHAFIDKQRNNGKLGGRPKKTQRKPTANPDQTQKKPNQQPLTTNQQPIKSATDVAVCLPDWMPLETWEAFLAMRKKIKKPATDYALKLLVGKLTKFRESGQDVQKVLEKSITAGWQDVFEIHEKQQFNKFDVSHVTTPPPPNQDAALRKIEEDRKNSKPPSLEVLAKMAALRKEISHG